MEILSYKYTIPYLIFLGYLIVLMFGEFTKINRQQSTKNIQLLTVVGFVFFLGFRGFIGWDWHGYYSFFQTPSNLLFANNFPIGVGMEYGFVAYTGILKLLTTNYHIYIFISVCIDAILFHMFFSRYAKYYTLSFIIFIALQGLLIEVNLLRNVKSILLFLLSIKYLQERKPLPYFVLNTIGVLFHSTSILYLPLYFVFHKVMPKRILIALFVFFNLVFLFQIDLAKLLLLFFSDLIGGRTSIKVIGYLSIDAPKLSMSIGYVHRILTALLIIIYYDKLKDKYGVFVNAYFAYFTLFFFLNHFLIFADRLGNLFIFSYWILWPALLDCFKLRSNQMLWLSFIVLFSFYKIANTTNNVLYHYDSVLFKHKTYENRRVIFENCFDELKAQ